MSGTQLLRVLVGERLSAAAEEIFGLVEKTIREYQEESVRSKEEISQLKKQVEQLKTLQPQVVLFKTDNHPSPQQLDIKVDNMSVLAGTENQDHQKVKEEQMDQIISLHMEDDTSLSTEDRLPKSDPKNDFRLLPSTTMETVSVCENMDNKLNKIDGSLLRPEKDFFEVVVELKKPPMERKTSNTNCSPLLNVERSPGNKDFKCFQCNREFVGKRDLVRHARVHTGEKPFSCDFCGRRFAQSFNRNVHMRVHTGEKPYYCEKCGKSFAYRRHLRQCKKIHDESLKNVLCITCGKTFHSNVDLNLHMEVCHDSRKQHIREKQGPEVSAEMDFKLCHQMSSL